MKTIGLIGGMSWESTVVYYEHLNRMCRDRLGGLHSAKLLLWSFDFARIERLQAADDWPAATELMIDAARNLERGGAECLVICTNTMHKMADDIQHAVDLPLIHIADATAHAIKSQNIKKPLLLATRYTMEQDFYSGRLLNHHGIAARTPNDKDRDTVHNIIYNELCVGVINDASREQYKQVVQSSIDDGVDGVILGCTEIGLLMSANDVSVPTFDTTQLHAEAALDFALS